jgi:K+-transporting ATPase ATPase C chain
MIALRVTLVTLLLTGIVYPLAVTGLAQVLFPARANGSLAHDEKGAVVGSELIAQGFVQPGYFQPRPSAAGNGYDGLASGGSNFGPTSQKLKARIAGDTARLAKDNLGEPPADLLTASGSGLDPHISPESALWQVPRVARARDIAEDRVRKVVEENVEARDVGFLGEPRVNVLVLNLALDKQFGRPAAPEATEAVTPDAGDPAADIAPDAGDAATAAAP